jgi:sulfonate transport system substrate-binding protein
MNKTFISLLLFLLVSAVLLTFLFNSRSMDSFVAATQTSQTVRIAVSQTPLSAPFYIARNNHYFEQEGVNVEFVPCSGGVACAEKLFNREVDYATASESVVMFESFKRSDFSVLASFVESDNDLKLLTRTSYEITSIKELVGKRVGVVKASASEFYLDSMLIINHIPSSEVTKVYLSPAKIVEALYNREVDAISIWEPHGYQAEQYRNSNIVNLGLPGVYRLSFNLLTRTSTKPSDKQASVQLLKALNKATEWMSQHPLDARKIVSEQLEIIQEQLDWSWNDYNFSVSLGNSLLINLQMQARWAINAHLVTGNPPDFRTFLASDIFDNALNSEDLL